MSPPFSFLKLFMKKGLTLVELLITIIIASILILMIGVIATTAMNSFEGARREDQVYVDAFSGMDLMQSRIRRAASTDISVVSGSTINASLVGRALIVGSSAFGLLPEIGGQTVTFVFIPNIANPSIDNMQLILTGAHAADTALTFIPDPVPAGQRLFGARIAGSKTILDNNEQTREENFDIEVFSTTRN